MTELFLIRHARALEHAANDWERPLTAEGRAEARDVGGAMKKAGVEVDVIAVSPLVRAVETASLIATEIGYPGGLTVDSALTPDGHTDGLLALCARFDCERVALVGHEPSMGQLLSDLVGRPGLSMVKAGVVRLVVDGAASPGAAKIAWQMSPRHLVPKRGG